MKAIILAGGKGTRLQPLTNTVPKALVPISGKTLLEKVLDNLPENIETVIITTKYLSELIMEKIGSNYNGKNIIYTKQSNENNGTWAALYSTKDHIEKDELFMVINCDDIFNKEELSAIVKKNKIGMGVTATTMPAQYHGIEINNEGYVVKLKPHLNTDKNVIVQDIFANGLYILDDTIFSFIPMKTSEGEFGIPQTLFSYLDKYPLFAHELKTWQACNSHEDLYKITTDNL